MTTQKILSLSRIQFLNTLIELKRDNEHEAAKKLVFVRCEKDLEMYSLLCFPHYCENEFNQLHFDFFRTVPDIPRGGRLIRVAPRGAAKSTYVSLILPLHDVCYKREHFIIYFSATDPLTVQKLKDVRSEVLFNPHLHEYYGICFQNKNVGDSQFIVCNDDHKTMFMAMGKGSKVRGVRFGRHRPTKIICDDVETSEEVLSEAQRSKTDNWFKTDLGKLGNKKTIIHFIGTVLHKEALAAKLLINPAYNAKKYKAIISWADNEALWQKWREIYTNLDIEQSTRQSQARKFFEANEAEMLKGTEVFWPQEKTYYDYQCDIVDIGRRAFFKEEQNEPLGADEPVFDTIHYYREVPQGLQIEKTGAIIPHGQFEKFAIGVIDPSAGQEKPKKGQLGDFTCILTAYKVKERIFVHADSTKRHAPSKYIQQIFDLHDLYNYHLFGVETNLYRNLLLPNIIEERTRREKTGNKLIKLPFYDIEQTENKRERITRLEPKVTHGYILFNRNLSREFMSQILDFPHADHDDGPDALEMIWNLAFGRYKPSAMSINAVGMV